jgi:predicted metalloendopeptidase
MVDSPSSLIDPAAMDKTTAPCENFYQYSCGSWIKNTTLPSDQSIWDRGFNSGLPQRTNQEITDILTSYAHNTFIPNVPYAKKLGDFYSSCMNQALINETSQAELLKQLALIDHIQTTEDLPKAIAALHVKQINVLFNFYSQIDMQNPQLVIGKIAQDAVLGMSKSNYLNQDSDSAKLRDQYEAYGATLFQLAGNAPETAKTKMKVVLAIETELAQGQLSSEDLNNASKRYHPMTLKQLESAAPSFDWAEYFQALSIQEPQLINVQGLTFLNALNHILKTYSLDDLKTYFQWEILQTLAPILSAPYSQAYFDFEQHDLEGQASMAPRDIQCEQIVSQSMGNAIGHAYVQKYFSPRAKRMAESMMKNIMAAFKADLQNISWLDDQTRQAALKKLSLMQVRIGYPDQWRSYDGLKITQNDLLENVLRAAEFNKNDDLNKINKPTNPNEFTQDPQEINASPIFQTNSIEVLAGILQPPYFSEDASDAENYGGIGLVMAHELTHGFDTSGRKFNAYGVMQDWWTKQSEQNYLTRVSCLEKQYSQYQILPGLFVNGDLTITENIADNGGLKLAYEAFKLADPKSSNSDDQKFFLSFSQPFCTKATDQYWRDSISNNPHSPSEFRVNGTVSNNDFFTEVFSCKAGEPMYPVKRCGIW